MKKHVLFGALVFAVLASQPARAQTKSEPEVASDGMAEVSKPLSTLPTIPKLNIIWDCGECEHNEKVVPLIQQAYADEAKKNAFAVSETDMAEVAITDIRQRPPAVRVMFGIMAGRDRIGLRIRYLGQEYTVSDTSANAIMGLNHLLESVGKGVYAKLATKPVQ